jgi:SM-20-related protein
MNQENLIISLIERGWYHSESFLDAETTKQLAAELNTLPLRPARIGLGTNELQNTSIRNDSLFWLNETPMDSIQNIYLNEMTKLMEIFNRELYLGLKQFEGHYARYEKNGFYKKHLDQFIGNKERVISVITYLNSPAKGGELRIFNKNNPNIIDCDISPKAGSIVCFLSHQIYHEVLPTMDERLSIAGWFRTNIL